VEITDAAPASLARRLRADRWRAAVSRGDQGGVDGAPAIVRPAGDGDDDERAELLAEAVIENDQRVDLDPLLRAATSGCSTRV
jgi:hypothetical protein